MSPTRIRAAPMWICQWHPFAGRSTFCTVSPTRCRHCISELGDQVICFKSVMQFVFGVPWTVSAEMDVYNPVCLLAYEVYTNVDRDILTANYSYILLPLFLTFIFLIKYLRWQLPRGRQIMGRISSSAWGRTARRPIGQTSHVNATGFRYIHTLLFPLSFCSNFRCPVGNFLPGAPHCSCHAVALPRLSISHSKNYAP